MRQKMHRYSIVFSLVIILMFFTACSIRTPEIHGVVLDEETKQPVEGAWVTATLGIKTKTVGGDSHAYLSVDEPHSRTDKNGKFVIHSKSFKKPSFPVGFGTDIETFGAGANTVDDRGGSIDLKQFVGRRKTDVIIYIKPEERTESEYLSHLQALYNYCLTGRFAVEVPAVQGGCDVWELDYAITKHKRYLKRWENPRIIENPSYGVTKWDRIIRYSGVQQQLGDLFKKRGDYKKALVIFRRISEFDKKHDLSLHIKEYENQITELERLLKKQGENND